MSAATTTNINTPHPPWLNPRGFSPSVPNEDIRPAIENKNGMPYKQSPKFLVREMSFAAASGDEITTLMDPRNSSHY